MANATKFDKSLVSGTKGTIVLEPQVMFQRKTNLPDNWLRCRMAMIYSFTNPTELNGTPNGESLIYAPSMKNRFLFGLSNGVSFPGEVGSRYVGFKEGTNSSGGLQLDLNTGHWRIKMQSDAASFYGVPLIADGATLSTASGNLSSLGNCWHDPVLTSGCFMALAIDIDASTSGVLKLSWVNTAPAITLLSSASDATMAGLITGTAFTNQVSTTGSTGWWDGTSTFCGLQYLTIRAPFLTNRLRIHNMLCIQTA